MTAGGEGFFGQFIEDYFSECDEHLATARRALLALESAVADGAPWPPLHGLFRSLHTLKGLSGMVGDAAAERVAHALEDALRSLETEHAAGTDTAGRLDLLFAGVTAIERCVDAHRKGEPRPDVGPLVAALERAASPAPQRARAQFDDAPDIATREAQRTVLHRFEFVPSAELTARGIGVEAVRTRLLALGAVLDAKPRIVANGVAFDFTVAVPGGVSPDARWIDDGIRWTIVDDAPEAMDNEPEPGSASIEAKPLHDGSAGARAPTPFADAALAASVVRVELSRLDDVMRLVGDLVVSRSRMDDALRQATANGAAALLDVLAETNAAMERQLRRLREGVMRIRLVPVGEVFERLRFAARDTIRESGKQARLVFQGHSTEIDKVVVDRLMEPLLHLVRNALSHGIESADTRVKLGKPAEGTLTLRAAASGDRIHIIVEDDGAGIDMERVALRAHANGLLAPDETLTDERLLDVLCAPGFSTRDAADRTSGRGVGMDVVRSAVRALSGELTVESMAGRGTKFMIELPLTLMILDALLIDVSGQQMAVPQPSLREILQVDTASIVTFENNDIIRYRDGVLPIVTLARLFDFPETERASCYLLVVGSEAAPMGLRVDRLIGLREIVVHPVADPLVAMPGVAGATDLGNGRVSLILDTAALLQMAETQRELHAARTAAAEPRPFAGLSHRSPR